MNSSTKPFSKLRIVVMLGIAVALSLSAGRLWRTRAGTKADQPFACSDPQAGCRIGASTAILRFMSPVRAAQSFDVRVEGVAASDVTIGFEMTGMEMGILPQPMQHQVDGSWLVHAWLPVCVQGRRDWEGVLSLDGVRYRFRFLANR